MELKLYRITWGDLQESFWSFCSISSSPRDRSPQGLLHETWLDFHNFPYLAIVLSVERFCVATHMPRFLQSAVPMPLQSTEFTRKLFRTRASHWLRHCLQWNVDHGFESLPLRWMGFRQKTVWMENTSRRISVTSLVSQPPPVVTHADLDANCYIFHPKFLFL